MRYLGAFIRSLLNINTIWGLMILSAFVLCAVQHYCPTSTVISPDALHEGNNKLAIRIAPAGQDAAQTYEYNLTMEDSIPVVASGDTDRNPERPWLISAERLGGGYVLTWDVEAHGDYELAVNDKVVRRGSLVTFQSLTDAAFNYAQVGFNIALGLVAAMVLFLGLMKVGEKAGIVQLVARLFHPIIGYLFPEVPKDHPASGAILMNVTSTVLGLGNAATPFGLKAMKELQTLNPHKEVANNSQVMLLAINTAGFALLPTTLLALRKSAGCSNPFEIIGTCMVAGATATCVAIIMCKLLGRLPFFSIESAVAEGAAGAAKGADVADDGEEGAQ